MNQPNTVKLKEVIRKNDILYFVFEYMECNLYQLMKDREKLFQKLKSEISVSKYFKVLHTCTSVDIFIVTQSRCCAPEVFLHTCLYTSKVDMWAMGATMAEFFTLCPLFPGTSLLVCICLC